MEKNEIVGLSDESVSDRIYTVRGQRVMIDADLADLYGVATKALKQQVKRNLERFPDDFMFILNAEELEILRSQFVTSSWGGSRYPPMAFTEHGVLMLSSVLRSQRAIALNIRIMRIFVRIRQAGLPGQKLLKKVEALEARMDKTDENVRSVFGVVKKLIAKPNTDVKQIGFGRNQ